LTPVNTASIQALKDMGAFMPSPKRFRVATEVAGERVLADGQKLQHPATARRDVERPNEIRAPIHGARSEREIIDDGRTVTLCTPAQKYHSTVEFTPTIGERIDKLEERYGVERPLQDLFLFGTPAARLDKIESATTAGHDCTGDDLCDHYAFRQGEIDWNPKPTFTDPVFKFTPSKGAARIEIVPRKGPPGARAGERRKATQEAGNGGASPPHPSTSPATGRRATA
jgi:hypothetical protein